MNNPIRHGVFTRTISFSIYSVDSLVKEFQEQIAKRYPKPYTETYTFAFKEFVDYEYWVDFETSLHNLNNIIRYINMENRKKDHPICRWSDILAEKPSHLFFKKSVKLDHFPTHASLPVINDAIHIMKKGHDKRVFLTITTLGKRGQKEFHKFLKAIPKIEFNLTEIRKRHSQQFVYRSYPASVFLWANVIGFHQISDSVRQFLNEAIHYFRIEEWRTAIVLSAISVEIMLAILYEENFKEEAPDVSLGKLVELLKEKVTFDSQIENAIVLANQKRISAVHRSQIQPSEKDATDALTGATKFAIWYSSKFGVAK